MEPAQKASEGSIIYKRFVEVEVSKMAIGQRKLRSFF